MLVELKGQSEWMAVQLSESVQEKRNRSNESKQTTKVRREHTEGNLELDIRKPSWVVIERSVKLVTCVTLCVSKSSGFHFSLPKIQTTATCWYGEPFPLMQEQNVRASLSPAAVFAVCSNATFWAWHRRCESVLIAASSLMTLWCVLGFRYWYWCWYSNFLNDTQPE